MKRILQLLSLTLSIIVCSCSNVDNSSKHVSDNSSFAPSSEKSDPSQLSISSVESLPSDDITSSLEPSSFEPRTFTVTWLNDDGSVLEVDENVIEGSVPSYDGNTPQKDGDSRHNYYFDGWDKELEPIYSETTFVAKYSNEIKTYSITWVFYDKIRVDECKYGDLPYYGEVEEHYYLDNARLMYFCGWNKEIEPVTKDTTYTAVFSKDKPSTNPVNSSFICSFIAGSDDKACYLTEYKGNKNDLVIPDFYNGVPIESIHSVGGTTVNSVYIGKNVKEIHENAFGSMNNLYQIVVDKENPYFSTLDGVLYDKDFSTLIKCPARYSNELVLPKSVKSIRNSALAYVTGLTSIVLPDLIPSSLLIINNYKNIDIHCSLETWLKLNKYGGNCYFHLFLDGNKEETTSLTIPDGITEINDYAFYNCASLTSIFIPNTVKSIGKYAFYFCRSLTSITIPNSVTSIGDNVFYVCSSLSSINVLADCSNFDLAHLISDLEVIREITVSDNDSVYKTKDNVLYSKDGRTLIRCSIDKKDEFIVPDSVVSISQGAFRNCSFLTSIVISNNVTSIDKNAFYGCDSLTTIAIPDSVTSIGSSAFQHCRSLNSIVIPSSVTSIGSSAFSGCESLKSFSLLADSSHFDLLAIIENMNKLETVNVSDTDTLHKTIDGVLYSKDAKTLVRCPINRKGVFKIPNHVISINNNAFRNCSSLTSITIPDSVNLIGSSAFHNCKSLESIAIPGSVITINDSAFRYCNSLTSIIINNGVQYIGSYTFGNCTSLKNIIIPNSVIYIGSYAFSVCTNLESVIINGRISNLNNGVFDRCSNLRSVVLQNSIVQISANSFNVCDNLSQIYFKGTKEEWQSIYLDEKNMNLPSLVYFYSDIEPSGDGNFWHYVNDVPTIW